MLKLDTLEFGFIKPHIWHPRVSYSQIYRCIDQSSVTDNQNQEDELMEASKA